MNILGGAPGSGKSLSLLHEIATDAARYLLASPTIDLIEEQARSLRDRNPSLSIIRIHSASGGRMSVGRQIADLLSRPADEHLAALITHEALMAVDLAGFHGWHARIDEPPHAVLPRQTDLSALLH